MPDHARNETQIGSQKNMKTTNDVGGDQEDTSATDPAKKSAPTFQDRFRFLFRFVAQPLMFFVAGLTLLALLGVAQRLGWISSGDAEGPRSATSESAAVDYICPMMCTPPQKEPGRCPVCAMELVPASGGSGGGDERSVVVDAATRRVANIQTASVARRPMYRTIRTVGELHYDESKLKTISAYTDGRFDHLYVDYTGADVNQGDRLASFYSPNLYSAQVEFLEATKSLTRRSSIAVVADANETFQSSTRQRLVEFGMSDEQIAELARNKKARSRIDIVAPIHGTVIQKLAMEGEYVQAGQPAFRLADLSTVWLMLKLFPEDAAEIRYGQSVDAIVKSLPDRTFQGRIAFIDPEVSKDSRTVNVRVVLENKDRLLRVGDYAKATIVIPAGTSASQPVYDPELANQWISPRHPHIVSDKPGQCRQCGIELVPAASFGYANQPLDEPSALIVPRSAVLSAASHSVVYVETETGRFEIRRVTTGPTSGDRAVILKGLAEGEKVAIAGSFLLDSQMQLAGNPSLIDPTRAAPPMEMIDGFDATMLAEIYQLPDNEQSIALKQVICPVTDFKLGSMGVPPKVMVDGKSVFLCCEGCRESLLEEPAAYLAKLDDYKRNGPSSKAGDQPDFDMPEIGEMLPIDGGNGFDTPVPAIQAIEIIDNKAEIHEMQLPFQADGGSKR